MTFLESRFSDSVFLAVAVAALLEATLGSKLVSAWGGLVAGVLSFIILNKMDERREGPAVESRGTFDRLGGWTFVFAISAGVAFYLVLRQLW